MRSGRGCARAVQLGQSMAGGVHGCGVWGINPSATGCAHARQTQAKRPTTACPLPTPSTQPGPTHQASPLLGWLRQRGGIQCARLLILPPHTLQQVAPVGQVSIVQPAPHGLEQLQLLHEPCGWSRRCGGEPFLWVRHTAATEHGWPRAVGAAAQKMGHTGQGKGRSPTFVGGRRRVSKLEPRQCLGWH